MNERHYYCTMKWNEGVACDLHELASWTTMMNVNDEWMNWWTSEWGTTYTILLLLFAIVSASFYLLLLVMVDDVFIIRRLRQKWKEKSSLSLSPYDTHTHKMKIITAFSYIHIHTPGGKNLTYSPVLRTVQQRCSKKKIWQQNQHKHLILTLIRLSVSFFRETNSDLIYLRKKRDDNIAVWSIPVRQALILLCYGWWFYFLIFQMQKNEWNVGGRAGVGDWQTVTSLIHYYIELIAFFKKKNSFSTTRFAIMQTNKLKSYNLIESCDLVATQ